MTPVRKNYPKLATLAIRVLSATRLSKALVCLGCLASMACKSSPAPGAARSAEQREEIRNQVLASKIIECRIIPADWTIPGDVGQAQMIKPNDQWALIYEALLRGGPRTVYQPLQANFSFNGDGVAMGLRGSPMVSDLKTFEDVHRNRWFISRVRVGQSELYSGLVEVLVKGTNHRSLLPLPPGHSVQQMWASLPAVAGNANIVVRTTPVEDAGGTGGEDESTFHWFLVGSSDNSARLMASYQPKGESVIPAGFVSLEKSFEPVAVTIVQPRLESADAEPSLGDNITRISLKRIFAKTVAERIIFAGKGIFSSLTLSDPTFHNGIHLAWIFSPMREGRKFLQSVAIASRFIPERFFAKGPVREIDNFIATELTYEANDPDFSFMLSNMNLPVPVLSWWGKLEDDVVLLVQIMTAIPKNLKKNILKARDGTSLGIQFQPPLAVIAPNQLNRIMFFRAAPTPSEKSLVIFSNRTESADIAKESVLHLCLF